MIRKFEVKFLADAEDFIESLDDKVRVKIVYNMRKASVLNDQELFKKITNSIWEFRTLFNGSHYRFFAFWDKRSELETLVVVTNGIIKKSDKIPLKDINKAVQIMNDYFLNNAKQ